jgi:hypothetical protein
VNLNESFVDGDGKHCSTERIWPRQLGLGRDIGLVVYCSLVSSTEYRMS